MRRRGWTAGVLIAVLAVAMSGCQKMEKVEVDAGYRGLAKLNPFLAAWRLLESRDWVVEERHGFSVLPSQTQVVVLAGESDASPLIAEQLSDWIRGGGHVVYLLAGTNRFDRMLDVDPELKTAPTGPRKPPSRPDENRKDPIPIHRPDVAVAEKPESEPAMEDAEDPTLYPLLTLMGLHVDQRPDATRSCLVGKRRFYLEMPAGAGIRMTKRLRNAPEVIRSDDHGVAGVISVPVGQGRLTVLGDGRIWRNRHIGEADHAALFWELMRLHGAPVGALFFNDIQISFFTLLWEHGWMALTGLATFVLCWLWRSALRFGPLLPDPAPASRDFTGHLSQAGAFLWSRVGGACLVEPLRHAVLGKLSRHHASGGEIPERQMDELVRLTGLSSDRIHFALLGPIPQHRHQFVELLALLQKIDSACP